MRHQIINAVVAGATVGDNALTILVTVGRLDPYTENLIAVILSLTLLVNALTLLIWTAGEAAR
ncbi:hypothetical protein [Actinoplanes flavus]|uniref:Uncharacterized protein n=1 Tax=Actinoplanes flavus TaxID=2820290 RepID=A0ABS3UL63_9ACTN|nr:hypothetical protein [Actinoplanes flavus]MBO3739530.1 hypothetical protein [Actinoplanes flavus]